MHIRFSHMTTSNKKIYVGIDAGDSDKGWSKIPLRLVIWIKIFELNVKEMESCNVKTVVATRKGYFTPI